jgi:hypothetical protein
MDKNGVAMLSIAAQTVSNSTDDTLSSTQEYTTGLLSPGNNDKGPSRSRLVLPDMTPEVRKDMESGGLPTDRPLSISKRSEWVDYPLKDIANPHPNDVRKFVCLVQAFNIFMLSCLTGPLFISYLILHLSLPQQVCGRGGGSNNHPGNEAFRLLVNEVKLPYVNCPKREKPLIARRIVEAVRNQSPPGRFLQKDGETGFWNDIGDGRAREKTSQALREGAPVIRNNLMEKTGTSGVTVEGGSAKKKKVRNSPVNLLGGEKQEQDGLNVNVDGAKLVQPPTSQPFSNQPPMSLGFHNMLNDKQSAISSYKEYVSSKMTPWQQNDFCPETRDELGERFTGFAPPSSMSYSQHRRRATMDYAPSHLRPIPDSIPYETVRGLLLGHLDPVQLAYTILPPEDAAAVARLHMTMNGNNTSTMGISNINQSAPINVSHNPQPLPLCSIISDGSSSPSECPSIKEELSSLDDSLRSNVRARAVLPKKKRKFIG